MFSDVPYTFHGAGQNAGRSISSSSHLSGKRKTSPRTWAQQQRRPLARCFVALHAVRRDSIGHMRCDVGAQTHESAVPVGVVLSYALCRNGRDTILQNAFSTTSNAVVIAHTCPSHDVNYHGIQEWLATTPELKHRRLIVNPVQVAIPHKSSPGVLLAHLSNFELCLAKGNRRSPRIAHMDMCLD